MKITNVDIIRLNGGRGPIAGNPWHPTVVRVNTDEGISGIGEIGLAYSESCNGSFGVAYVACVRDAPGFARHKLDFYRIVFGMPNGETRISPVGDNPARPDRFRYDGGNCRKHVAKYP